MKTAPSSDMLVIWINIWDFQRDSKSRTLIDCLFNFGQYTTIVWETDMYSVVAWYLIITSVGNIQHMFIMLKAPNIKNIIIYIEWRTTNS